ncbi:MAG: Nramp family divalent metal transporter [Gemmatimonadota bacterium]|nr:Nramp family divalent metal transporter [Gemmatimonadota bacterium]
MNIPPPEARSGLKPFQKAELPPPPNPKGLSWIGVVGPGVIVLGASIGSGEFLLGPVAFVQYGLVLLWVTLVAAFLQTVLNTELMRWTIATGEPVVTGFMRTKPGSQFWAWLYAILYFLQVGWPGWAAAAAGAIFFLIFRELAGPGQELIVYWIGVGTFALCVGILLFGKRIERTLELLNWILVAAIIGGFLILAAIFVSGDTWVAAAAGLVGYDTTAGSFRFVPEGVDWFLIGAFAAYSGAGGVINLTLSNWARDKGYGMGERAGYIPAAVGGERTDLSPTGYTFDTTSQAMERWRGWWRIVRADQWGVYFLGAMLGMVLPAVLYVTFIEGGTNIRGLSVAAALANAMASEAGAIFGGVIAMMAVWVLFKTQLDIIEGMTRAMTDILWTGSSKVRRWRGGDVRFLYYTVLGLLAVWGIIAMRLAAPIVLLQLGANIAGVVFVISALHVLYINTRFLPEAVRPPMWRRVALVTTSLFYGAFVLLWINSMF